MTYQDNVRDALATVLRLSDHARDLQRHHVMDANTAIGDAVAALHRLYGIVAIDTWECERMAEADALVESAS